MEISRKQFDKFEKVRESGQCNMFDIKRVCILSDLEEDVVRYIEKNYERIASEVEDETINPF